MYNPNKHYPAKKDVMKQIAYEQNVSTETARRILSSAKSCKKKNIQKPTKTMGR